MEMDEHPEDDLPGFRSPLPPEDRLWRHPSEIAGLGAYGAPPDPPRPPAAEAAGAAGRAAVGLWPVVLVSALIGAVAATGIIVASGGMEPGVIERQVIEREQVRPVSLGPEPRNSLDNVVAIAERVRPAITRLEIGLGEDALAASGSGVIFRSDGYLLTNSHVVNDATSINVVLANGQELEGELIGEDPATDIAVVKIDRDNLPTATLGSAVDLRVGEGAIAIGSPLGLAGGPSVTVGVVSALGRRIDGQNETLHDMIQTDAPIAPGSSGGALLDRSGAVIGITTAIAVSDVGAEGLGFATPIDIAREVAEDLITDGKVQHVWLGIQGQDVDADTAAALGIDGGALVRDVVDDSPAAAAGLRNDDVIVAIDERPIANMSALVVALRRLDPGTTVQLTVRRGEEQLAIDVAVAERPDDVDELEED